MLDGRFTLKSTNSSACYSTCPQEINYKRHKCKVRLMKHSIELWDPLYAGWMSHDFFFFFLPVAILQKMACMIRWKKRKKNVSVVCEVRRGGGSGSARSNLEECVQLISPTHSAESREVRQLISEITKVIRRRQQNQNESQLVNQVAKDNLTRRDEGVIGTNGRIKEEDISTRSSFLPLCVWVCVDDILQVSVPLVPGPLHIFIHCLSHHRVKYLYSTSNHSKLQKWE